MRARLPPKRLLKKQEDKPRQSNPSEEVRGRDDEGQASTSPIKRCPNRHLWRCFPIIFLQPPFPSRRELQPGILSLCAGVSSKDSLLKSHFELYICAIYRQALAFPGQSWCHKSQESKGSQTSWTPLSAAALSPPLLPMYYLPPGAASSAAKGALGCLNRLQCFSWEITSELLKHGYRGSWKGSHESHLGWPRAVEGAACRVPAPAQS